MEIRLNKRFSKKLLQQLAYIAEDKPEAAAKFYSDLFERINELSKFPLKHRQSIYAKDAKVRDLIFKGYTVTYRIEEKQGYIDVFSLIKHQRRL